MKLTVVRAIPIALAIAIGALFLSGVHRFKTAHHGLDAVVGEAAWLCFLIAALSVIVLVAVAIYRRRVNRRQATITSATICALALAILAGASSAAVAPTVTATLGSHGPDITGPTHWQPGPIRIAASTKLPDQELAWGSKTLSAVPRAGRGAAGRVGVPSVGGRACCSCTWSFAACFR